MTPEIVDPWDVERTAAEVGTLDLADTGVLSDVAAGSDNSPEAALDIAPGAKTVATSVVSVPSIESFASGAVRVAEGLPNGAAIPAIFAGSPASASVKSPGFLAADSRSPGFATLLPASEAEPIPEGVKSSPISEASAAVSDSPFCERNRTLLSAASDACRTAALDESASFRARANDAEEFSSAPDGLSALEKTESGFDSLGTTVGMTQSRWDT
jgi:hypothetical protein